MKFIASQLTTNEVEAIKLENDKKHIWASTPDELEWFNALKGFCKIYNILVDVNRLRIPNAQLETKKATDGLLIGIKKMSPNTNKICWNFEVDIDNFKHNLLGKLDVTN